jgi:hypothetical protein
MESHLYKHWIFLMGFELSEMEFYHGILFGWSHNLGLVVACPTSQDVMFRRLS